MDTTRKRYSFVKSFQSPETRRRHNQWRMSMGSSNYARIFIQKKQMLQRAFKKFLAIDDPSSKKHTVYTVIFMSLGESLAEEFKDQVAGAHRTNKFQSILRETIRYRKLTTFEVESQDDIEDYFSKVFEFMDFLLWLLDNHDKYADIDLYVNQYMKRLIQIINIAYTKAKKDFLTEAPDAEVDSLMNIFKSIRV
jgi:hypothetical protein